MRQGIVLVVALSSCAGINQGERRALPDERPCECGGPAELESGAPPSEIESSGIAEDRRYLWKVVTGGIATFAFGQSLALAYAGTRGRHADGVIDALPVVGPLVVEAHDRAGGGWSSALGLSAFLQASAVMIVAIAGVELADLRVEPRLQCSRHGASRRLASRF